MQRTTKGLFKGSKRCIKAYSRDNTEEVDRSKSDRGQPVDTILNKRFLPENDLTHSIVRKFVGAKNGFSQDGSFVKKSKKTHLLYQMAKPSLLSLLNKPEPNTSLSALQSSLLQGHCEDQTHVRIFVEDPKTVKLLAWPSTQGQTFRSSAGRMTQQEALVPVSGMVNVALSDNRRLFLTNLYLNRELDRLASFAGWSSNIHPTALAKSGFYFLGDTDRVQCFSCGATLCNWTHEDNAERQYRHHSNGCNMVIGNEPRNIPIPFDVELPGLLADNYPLRFPANPRMRDQAEREATFDERWPARRRINETVKQLAEAGLYYFGEQDKVKCFYCNGVLQNWEFGDKPWEEHAKWFPSCQFLLRMKGQRFVHYHLGPHAQLPRPIIRRQDGSPLDDIARLSNLTQGYNVLPVPRRSTALPLAVTNSQPSHCLIPRHRRHRIPGYILYPIPYYEAEDIQDQNIYEPGPFKHQGGAGPPA